MLLLLHPGIDIDAHAKLIKSDHPFFLSYQPPDGQFSWNTSKSYKYFVTSLS